MYSRPSTRAIAIVVAALVLIGGFAAPVAGVPLSDGEPSSGTVSDSLDASLTDAIVNETTLDGASTDNTNDSVDDDAESDGLLDDTETADGSDGSDTTDSEDSEDDTSDTDGTETELGDEHEETTDSLEDATNETSDGLEDTTDNVTEPLEDVTNETTDELETAVEDVEDTTSTVEDATFLETDTRTRFGVTLGVPGTENATLNASAGLESGEPGAEGDDDGSATADSSHRSNSGASTDESESNAQSASGSPTHPSGGSTATDAVLVGLMGTITASSAAAAGASSAGAGAGTGAGLGGTASNLATNWLHPTQSRWLRRFLSLVPAELLSVLGYSRYDDSDPLENDRREAIYELIRAEPGCYLSEVSDRQDVSLSTVRHHVRILEEEGLIASVAIDGKRRYFTVEDEADAALHAALAESAKREVLEALADLGPVNNGRLAEELERDPSTVSHHLAALEDDGLVVRERDGRAVVNDLAADTEAAIRGESSALEESEPRPSVPSPADD